MERGARFRLTGRPLRRGAGGALAAGPPVDVEIDRGRICAVAPYAPARGPGEIGGPEEILAPGLSDAHLHLVATAAARLGLDLATDPPASLGALLARLRGHAGDQPADAWVRASGYDEAFLAERRPPTREELDGAAAGRPVRLRHATRHASVLSTSALAVVEASLGRLAPEVAPRDAAGRPSGLVIGIEEKLTAVVPPASEEALGRAVGEVSCALLAGGVVCVDEITASNDAARVRFLADQVESGRIAQRLRVWVRDAEEADRAREAARGLVEIAGVKLLARSAEEAASEGFRERVRAARRSGLPLAVHAVESDVIGAVLDAFSAAPARAAGGAGRRARGASPGAVDGNGGRAVAARGAAASSAPDLAPDRLEHASLCPPHLARRIAAAGVAVVTQPAFLVARGVKYESDVEEPLWPWLYPIRSLRSAGILVAAGSDAPVAPVDPALGLLGATTRRSASGTVLGPDERLAPWEALDLFTASAARVRGEAADGWLAPGAPADLAILAADPCATGVASWRARYTVVRGRLLGGEASAP